MAEVDFGKKFEVIHFLDSIRWQATSTAYLVNFAYPNQSHPADLSEDEKLLTHWLLYITDRQMPFEQIWDKGGVVFSEIVHKFEEEKSVDFLLGFTDYFRAASDGAGYEFVSKLCYRELGDGQKRRLAAYYTHEELELAQAGEVPVVFKSRYYTDDFLCMLYTLYVLADERFDGSFTTYLAKTLEKVCENPNLAPTERTQYLVLGMAYALYHLTYKLNFTYAGKRITYETLRSFLESGEFERRAAAHKAHVMEDIFDADADALCRKIKDFFDVGAPVAETQARFYSKKRLWCALRDYLKSPSYAAWFQTAIRARLNGRVAPDVPDALFDRAGNSRASCQWLELPGDVWNENSTFRRCITNRVTGKLAPLLREEYTRLSPDGYPEEFDTTFDFVPRMCDKHNCAVCPFGAIKDAGTIDRAQVEKLCVAGSGKYCPLVLLCCGYYYECTQTAGECVLRKHLTPDA